MKKPDRRTGPSKQRRKLPMSNLTLDPHNEIIDTAFDDIEEAEREAVQRYRPNNDE